MYDSLSEKFMLLSRFMKLEFLRKLKAGKRTQFDVENSEKYLSGQNMFIGILRNSLELLVDYGIDII